MMVIDLIEGSATAQNVPVKNVLFAAESCV
jgi:hypothetical protein